MYSIRQYLFPQSLEEAYQVLLDKPGNTIIGGSTYLRMSGKTIDTAIDISHLDLNFIHETDNNIEIGAMTTLRDIETSPLLSEYFSAILPKAVANIVGVQLRNMATVGATVYSRYGFSDLNTALLALDADVVLYKGGRIPLQKFMQEGISRDILVKLMIPKTDCKASFQMMRNSQADYAILNTAVSRQGDDWRIAVGARPGRGELAKNAAAYLGKSWLTPPEIETAAQMAVNELTFGSNIRGSREYRAAICRVLIKRAVQEVLAWR